jgi:DNA-binding phage protein
LNGGNKTSKKESEMWLPLSEIMAQEENCLKCKFWKKDPGTENFLNLKIYPQEEREGLCSADLSGLCRRRSPSPLSWEYVSPTEDDEGKDGVEIVYATWPTTYADDYCGDFVLSIIETPEVEGSVEETHLAENLKVIVSAFKKRRVWGKRGLFSNIAKETGFTAAYVGQVFTGKKNPADKFILAVCSAFEIKNCK